ncbi:uncharacterized protein LOC132185777 isoform X2 [Corylus avellana]|uniref:uncharacterized protein LOC132185777 isoform X2 n=1 Tax=Corylus avellana TaxID=13451 RepID=UPI00286BE8E7|nr:uncharacterized protein LOC132185777 isoform X2 [Corylus avellana]
MAEASKMASDVQEAEEQQPPSQKIQIFPTITNVISPFWREKYEREAKRYWDIFYKRHQDRFFKDRHYLDKEWGHHFSGSVGKVILEMHKDFKESQVSAFVCDLTVDDLSKQISTSSVDIVTMIFVLSAVAPEKMPLVLQNIRKVLKPNGYVLFRDYATGDLAQERFTSKDQKISENFYVRGDGTRAFYFSNMFLTSLFEENGFVIEELGLCCKQVENRLRELVMNRRWIQAVFRLSDDVNSSSSMEASLKKEFPGQEYIQPKVEESKVMGLVDNSEVDISESVAVDMFGISPSNDNEIIEVNVRGSNYKIKVLSKEYQHTCKSTGLMLWESARLMAYVLAGNPTIVAGKRVLELGCGCAGICSMIAAGSADLVVATDGDTNALDLLTQNITSNTKPPFLSKLITKRLEWGNRDHIEAIKEINHRGFDVIIGTDVTYIPEAILPLFATAKELISSKGDQEPAALILCHVLRRVDEPSILSAAFKFGFRHVDQWPAGTPNNPSNSIISSWFSDNVSEYIPSAALNIMYFLTE